MYVHYIHIHIHICIYYLRYREFHMYSTAHTVMNNLTTTPKKKKDRKSTNEFVTYLDDEGLPEFSTLTDG